MVLTLWDVFLFRLLILLIHSSHERERERERERADGYNDVLLITCDLFQMLGVKTPPEPPGSLQRT